MTRRRFLFGRATASMVALVWASTGCDPSMTAYDCSRVEMHRGHVADAESVAGLLPATSRSIGADCAYMVSPAAFKCIERATATREMEGCVARFPYTGPPAR